MNKRLRLRLRRKDIRSFAEPVALELFVNATIHGRDHLAGQARERLLAKCDILKLPMAELSRLPSSVLAEFVSTLYAHHCRRLTLQYQLTDLTKQDREKIKNVQLRISDQLNAAHSHVASRDFLIDIKGDLSRISRVSS